jgi:hypothetical protein
MRSFSEAYALALHKTRNRSRYPCRKSLQLLVIGSVNTDPQPHNPRARLVASNPAHKSPLTVVGYMYSAGGDDGASLPKAHRWWLRTARTSALSGTGRGFGGLFAPCSAGPDANRKTPVAERHGQLESVTCTEEPDRRATYLLATVPRETASPGWGGISQTLGAIGSVQEQHSHGRLVSDKKVAGPKLPYRGARVRATR